MLSRLDTGWCGHVGAIEQGRIELDSIHEVVWERSGAVGGVPVLYVDVGEPRDVVRRICDPARFDLVIMSRRGDGSTKNSGALIDNDLGRLVGDIELVRARLGFGSCIVLGQGRGATLGLRYAQSHPESCAGLLLSGSIRGQKADRQWRWRGPEALFPDVWRELKRSGTDSEEFAAELICRCLDDDPNIWRTACLSVMRYETQIGSVRADHAKYADMLAHPGYWSALGRINMHYDANNHFLSERELADGLKRIRHLPAVLLHGRYDTVAPLSSSYEFARSWPQAKFHIIPGANHSWRDEQMCDALTANLNALANRL